jgi:hypothetical protein
MLKILRRISAAYVAYLVLLLGFASLGLFVAALASGSDLAGVAGVSLVACLAGAVAGFRKGARTLAQSRGPGERANNVSIFSVPLRRDQIDRYHENYRSDKGSVPQLGRVMAAKGVTPLGRDRTLAGRLTYLSGRGIHGRSARPVETA